MEGRRCKACQADLGVDEDICRTCGERNEIRHPWYIWPIGFLIVAVLAALLIDVELWTNHVSRILGSSG